jgi:CRISPR-associated exonuclease Cas4
MTRGESFPQGETLAQNVGGQTVTEHLDDIRKFYYHETTFTSDDNELFFAKKVLLVEGPVDKYGVPRLARVMGVNFDQLTIISCNGKEKIPHYAMVCQAYAIPAFVLFDFDGKGAVDEQNTRVVDLCKDISVGHFETSFEELLGIGVNASHKASNALKRIDEIKTESEVPAEIAKVIRDISNWCSSG